MRRRLGAVAVLAVVLGRELLLLARDRSSSIFDRVATQEEKSQNCPVSNVAVAFIATGVNVLVPVHVAPFFQWALFSFAAHSDFCGHVMIITDVPPIVRRLISQVQHLHHDKCQSIRFHVVHAKSAGMLRSQPLNAAMSARLYKTKLFDMLPESAGREVDQILYLDSDILVVKPIDYLLNIARTAATTNETHHPPALMMIPEQSGNGEPWHGGMFLVSRKGEQCMQEWGNAIASGNYSRDQVALANCPRCLKTIERLPDEIMYFPDPGTPVMPEGTPLVHYSKNRRGWYWDRESEEFEKHVAFLQEIDGIPEQALGSEPWFWLFLHYAFLKIKSISKHSNRVHRKILVSQQNHQCYQAEQAINCSKAVLYETKMQC